MEQTCARPEIGRDDDENQSYDTSITSGQAGGVGWWHASVARQEKRILNETENFLCGMAFLSNIVIS